MAVSANIEVAGIKDALAKLNRIDKGLRMRITREFKEVMQPVVDEAQNLEPTTLKTILTRIGEGTKVVFTGDTSQIDAPYMGESNNALAVLIHAFANQHCFGHVTLASCERSEVASLAAELL